MAVKLFNNALQSFLEEMCVMLDHNEDIVVAKNAVITARKANPKLLPVMWMTHVTHIHEEQIMAGDLHYFLDHDFAPDLQKLGGPAVSKLDSLLAIIRTIKDSIRSLPENHASRVVSCIQRITVLSKVASV